MLRARVKGFLGWAQRVCLLPLVISVGLLAFGYFARMRLVDQALPYCQHIDEHTWTRIATRILKTGDLNPHRFTKPSLMVYLDTAAFALGLLKSGMSGEALPPLAALREGGYPYYASSTMIRTAHQVYVLVSLATMTLTALIARSLARSLEGTLFPTVGGLTRKPWGFGVPELVGLLTLGLTLLSSVYLRYSHWYLGVDLLGCFFTVLAIAYLLLHSPATKPLTFAAICGVLSGLCIGTKYNLYPIALPPLLAIALHYREVWLSSILIFVGCMVGVFLLTTPFAAFDLPTFITSVAGEAHHYATGHGKFSRSGGLTMFLAYGKWPISDYGWGLVLLSLIGVVAALRTAPRRALLVVCYPVALWIYMSGQRVFFPRNLLVLQLVLPIFASIGLVLVFRFLAVWLRAGPFSILRRRAALWAAILLAFGVVISFPVGPLVTAYAGPVESRNELVPWVTARPEQTVLVARELEMDVRLLKRSKRVVMFQAKGAKLSSLAREFPGSVVLVPVFNDRKAGPRIRKVDQLGAWGKNQVNARKGGASSSVKQGDPRVVAIRLDSAAH